MRNIIDIIIEELQEANKIEHPGIYIERLEKIKEKITKEIIKEKTAQTR